MNLTDPIADMLTRIRNAQATSKSTVLIPTSRVKLAIAKVLRDEGYIGEFVEVQVGDHKRNIEVTLKYYKGKPVIERIERISRPGLKQYRGRDRLPRVMNGLGVAIISTSQGVMSDAGARERGLGGEVLCLVA